MDHTHAEVVNEHYEPLQDISRRIRPDPDEVAVTRSCKRQPFPSEE